MYYLTANNKTSKELKFSIIKRPSIPCPKKKYNKSTEDGVDGDYYEDTGFLEDIEITVSCNFVSNNFNHDWRRIKRWINNIQDYTLKFSDDKDYFYKFKTVEINEDERIIKRIGKFTLKFVCDPYSYLEEGLDEFELPEYLENDYCISKPVFKVEGNGICTFIINGNITQFKVDEYLYIDSNGFIYKEIGKYLFTNALILNDFSDLFLIEGENTFSWSNGFTISMIPNYRE